MDEDQIHWIFETAFKSSIRILGGSDNQATRSRFYMRALLLAERFPSQDTDFQLKTLEYLEKMNRKIGEEIIALAMKSLHLTKGS